MIATTAAADGVSLAIRKITADAMAGAVAFKQFETETGASAQELQKWQSVAEQTNQTAESVTSAIKSIVANQEKIKLGQGNISGFQLLGIDPRQDPFKILEELRTKTKDLSDGMKKNILAQMGVGVGLLQTLELTREQFDAMASRAFIISPGAIETLNKTKSSIDLAARAIKYIKAQIAVGLSPQIAQLTRQFTNFIKVNEKGIIKGFQKALFFVKAFAGAIGTTLKVINNLVSSTIGWENAIKGMAVAFGILNVTLLASPLNLIIAGIILLVAVLEDIAVYSRGGRSLFGLLMEKFPGMENVLFGFMNKLIQIKDLFKAMAAGDRMAINDILDQWGLFGDIIQVVYDGLVKIDEFLKGGTFMDWAFGEEDETGQRTQTEGFNRMFGTPGAKTTTNAINIEVYGVSSPEDVAAAVSAEMQRVLNSTSAQRSRNE